MSATTRPNGQSPGVALREKWRAESLRVIWLRPGDWYHPVIDSIAEAATSGVIPACDLEDLGRVRADLGVGITETIDDVACLYRVIGIGEAPMDAIRALSAGWADGQAGLVVTAGVMDPETGLPTQAYLRTRLTELYAEAVRLNQKVPARFTMVAVDVAVGEVDALLRAARSAAVGAALRHVVGSGYPIGSLGGGIFIVVLPRHDSLDAVVARLRRAIERRVFGDFAEVVRDPIRIWQVTPADSAEGAAVQLSRLARPATH